ncbi:predicted GPI-anchored protein 58 [Homalodisca vitripennis]|uniref:predicted GPI-anchored protein 58 n=1 Tax=Homalodisca vitripennis TaxID=197043 RepID=UPI001EEBDEAE|nr:predicted GPI-anchored protein 58 [Homalodisca vitripennis]
MAMTVMNFQRGHPHDDQSYIGEDRFTVSPLPPAALASLPEAATSTPMMPESPAASDILPTVSAAPVPPTPAPLLTLVSPSSPAASAPALGSETPVSVAPAPAQPYLDPTSSTPTSFFQHRAPFLRGFIGVPPPTGSFIDPSTRELTLVQGSGTAVLSPRYRSTW